MLKEIKKIFFPITIRLLMIWVNIRFKYAAKFKSLKHDLPHELIISLTSYPKRFNNLHLTLKCLLTQTVQPDRVVLWIAEADKNELPNSVLSLKDSGLEIMFTEDIKSYKKLIPSLEKFPNAGFIIADDDLFYRRDLIEKLLNTAKQFPNNAIAGRVHRVSYDENGEIKPYKKWIWNSTIQNHKDNFCTGGAGTFFPPFIFHKNILDKSFLELAPSADDVWFNWMIKLNDKNVVALPKTYSMWDWPGSQENALHVHNVKNYANDEQIKLMIEHYGKAYE